MRTLAIVRRSIGRIDGSLAGQTRRRLDSLTKPQGSLGRLEDLAVQIVEIMRQERPVLSRKVIFTMAGDHGVTAEGVSAFPKEVTPQMVANFLQGGAGINVLARHVGARVVIADLGVACDLAEHPNLKIKKVAYGSHNMAKGPAMTRDEALGALENGIALFDEEYAAGIDIMGTGEMGIGNTTPSAAITAIVTGRPVRTVTGRGTGIGDAAFAHKVSVIETAIRVNAPDPHDPIDVLAKVGGFEIGGLAGAIMAAASVRVPVVIDGFISGAAALIACALEPNVKDYLIAAHSSVEQGHRAILEHLNLKPILALDMRLGEGTGAALALSIVEAAVKILTEMATFGAAGVAEKEA